MHMKVVTNIPFHSYLQGGAVLADIMRDKPEFWISKQEWAEHGTRILKKKCGGV